MSERIPGLQSAGDRAATPIRTGAGTVPAKFRAEEESLREAVEYALGDCFFAVGQTIGMRMTVDYDAVVWWHDHFRTKFLAAMRRQGNRWLQDRENVTAVGWMLAERAVRHAAGQSSVDVQAARRATADVERYCQIREKRTAPAGDIASGGNSRLVGYWCLPLPR